jgi:hypothetical protein
MVAAGKEVEERPRAEQVGNLDDEIDGERCRAREDDGVEQV